MMELLGVLSELYHSIELKLNMKFEIEVLCRDLDIDIMSDRHYKRRGYCVILMLMLL